ncbi:MAG: hypothetical protein ACLUW6_09780 [Coriobacteriaceae bacterium]
MMRDRALGRDRSEVAEDDEVKSVSNEVTYARDLETREDIGRRFPLFRRRWEGVCAERGSRSHRGREGALRQPHDPLGPVRASAPTDDDIAFAPWRTAWHRLWAPGMKVRLLGVAVTISRRTARRRRKRSSTRPPSGGDDRADAVESEALIRDEEKRRSLLAATDALQERFGDGTVRFGFELRQSGNTTGSSSKNVEDYK